jgi:hypothetical protein
VGKKFFAMWLCLLEHCTFETLCSALTAKVHFAYISHAGGGASRCRSQNNRKMKLL